MREGIGLYRGKRKDNGEWVEGFVFYNPTATHIAWYKTNGLPEVVEVDPESIGQWTGLVDANGVKIFEGDIAESVFTKMEYVVCYGEYSYTVECGEEDASYGWYTEDINGFKETIGCPGEWAIVIGNIHDEKAVEE